MSEFDSLKTFFISIWGCIKSLFNKLGVDGLIQIAHDTKSKFIEDVLANPKLLAKELAGLQDFTFTFQKIAECVMLAAESILRTAYALACFIIYYVNSLSNIGIDMIVKSMDATWGLYDTPQYVRLTRNFLAMTQNNLILIILATIFIIKTITKGLRPTINLSVRLIKWSSVITLISCVYEMLYNTLI